MKSIQDTLNTVNSWIVVITCFLLPIFFLPLTLEPFELAKFGLIIVATLLLLLTWAIDLLTNKKITVVIAPFTGLLFFFTMATVLSWAIVSPSKIQSLLTPSSVGTNVALFIFYYLLTILLYKDDKLGSKINTALISSGIVLSIATFLSISRVLATIPLPALIKDANFTLAGGPLVSLTVSIVLFILGSEPLLIRIFAKDFTEKKENHPEHVSADALSAYWHGDEAKPSQKTSQRRWTTLDTLYSIASGLLAFSIAVNISQLTTSAKPVLLPYWAGWAIVAEGLKYIKTALFGVGPANYVSAFTQWKPIGLNATSVWNLRFSVSSNYFFQLAGEIGLIGLLAYIFFSLSLVKKVFANLIDITHQVKFWLYALVSILVLELLLPTNTSLLFLTVVLTALVGSRLPNARIISERSVIFSAVLSIVITAVFLVVLYFGSRAYLADMIFNKAVVAVQTNQAEPAYNKNIQALQFNPYFDLYHITYSQTNLALAQGLARQEKIDDATRSNISTFIQQSIREAKAAVAINPTKAANWENLATVYRNIINIADGADAWTTQVYQQAIALDPTNPLLRLNLGGVYYALGRYDAAIDQFRIAVQLKNDYANGYYNLSVAYRDKGELQNALAAMQEVVRLVPADNADFDRARKELEDLEKKVGTPPTPTTQSGNLLTKPATSSAKLKPPLSLPKETAPGKSENNGNKEPEPTPTTSP